MNKKLIQYCVFTLTLSTVSVCASTKKQDAAIHTNKALIQIIYNHVKEIRRLKFTSEENVTEDHIQKATKILEISLKLDDIVANNRPKISSSMQSSIAKVTTASKAKYSKIITKSQS